MRAKPSAKRCELKSSQNKGPCKLICKALVYIKIDIYPLMAFTPGNSLPSIYSSKAPPPVET
jgi:hypothetical protein